MTDPGTAGAPPRKLGRLTLLKPIARGGMGEVFLAASGAIEGAERPCVVKVVRRDHAKDQSFLARFFDEARVQAQLHHPGVAQVLEASTDPRGMPYVVVEFVEGRNLGEVRTRCSQLKLPMSWADAAAVVISVAEALVHVHERVDAVGRPLGIVHRDLSPQNVMLSYSGDVKLIDFGTARGENRKCHTVDGVVFAKPGYVAPEVANNTPGGIPADLYAIGIILWELITGRRFLSGDAKEHLLAVAEGKANPPPIAAFMDIPLELDTVIARMTAPRPQDRYTSARDVVSDLVRILKRGPTLANGARSVRERIAHLMGQLYPSEPARTRAEFARLISTSNKLDAKPPQLPESPGLKSRDDLFPGTRYRVLKEISRSDLGVVLEALHVDLGRRVAIKVLPAERCNDPEFESRFRSEARSIANIRHESLVNLHDFGVSSDGRPFYAMELLEGETLAQYLERERGMDWRDALRVGIQVCDALAAAHDARVVHRDIKPANIFLTRSGKLKLIDFGLAKVGNESARKADSDAIELMGTPAYMAPEQISSSDVDLRADLYALGTVLYELATGHLPYDAESSIALLEKKLSYPAPEPSKQAPLRGIPRGVDRVILRALCPAPEGRYESAKAMRSALQQAVDAPARDRQQRRRITLGAMIVSSAAAAFVLTPGLGVMRLMPIASSNAQATGFVAPSRMEETPVYDLQPETAAPELPETTTPKHVEGSTTPSTDPESEAPVPAEKAPEEPAVEQPPQDTPDEELEQRLGAAEAATRSGKHVVALIKYRQLGKQYPKSAAVYEGWARAARKTKAWGEALRVATQWAEMDKSAKAQLNLAGAQRSVGKRSDAVATLQEVLSREPGNTQAKTLLSEYGGSALRASVN